MGECGCVMNDRKYLLPGPGEKFYVVTLSAGCVDCDAPSGVTIERIQRGDFMFSDDHRTEFTNGMLKFEKWSDSEGVAIVTGLRRHEFVAKLKSHLIGVSSEEMGENGVIDDAGAEVILEEMHDDSNVTPHFPKRQSPSGSPTES